MNKIYYGKIGSGKSYAVMFQEIIPALRSGRKVVTNIDGLDVSAIRNYIGRDIDLTVKTSYRWWRENLGCKLEDNGDEGRAVLNPALEEGALYAVDECQLIWDARGYKDTSDDFLNLITYNRHFGIDIIFITQNVKRCDVNITRLANDAYQIKNLGFLHSFGEKKYAVNRRQTPFDKDVIAQYTATYDKTIFSLYKSGVDVNAVKQKTRFKTSMLYVWLMLLFVGVFFLMKVGNPIGAIAKMTPETLSVNQNQKKGVSNVNNPLDISGIPAVTYSKIPAPQDSGGSLPPEKSHIKPMSSYSLVDLDMRCVSSGYVKNDTVELRYYECDNSAVIVRNGVVEAVYRKKQSSSSPSFDKPLKQPLGSPAPAGSLPLQEAGAGEVGI